MIFNPIDVECPHCGAASGVLCHTPSGSLLQVRGGRDETNFHMRRINAAHDASDYKDETITLVYKLPKKLAHKVRCHTHIWCDTHGDIHETTNDPYGYGTADCDSDDWRRVYIETDNKQEKFL